jgi:hypothetical protein
MNWDEEPVGKKALETIIWLLVCFGPMAVFMFLGWNYR